MGGKSGCLATANQRAARTREGAGEAKQGKGTQPPAVTVSHFESQREKEFPCARIAFVHACFFVRFQHTRGTLSGCAERAVGSSCAFCVTHPTHPGRILCCHLGK